MILDGIELKEKQTPSGTWYYEYGESHLPTAVYFHGIDQRGNGDIWSLPLVLDQGICARQWVNGGHNAWAFKEVFSLGIRILIPQLPKSMSEWSLSFVESFLDATHTNQPLYLTGWSLGGGAVVRYMAQANKKHKFKGACLIATGDYSHAGVNFDVPTKAIHSPSDTTTIKTQTTDKIWAGIPAHFKVSYDQPSGGGHWVETSFWNPSTGIYEWINSLFQDIQIPTPEGKLILENGKVYGVFDTQKIELVRL